MYLPLNSIDFQIHVYLNKNWVFDVIIKENETGIEYYGKGKNKIVKNQKISQKDIIDKSQIDSYWHMVFATMQRELGNVWRSSDTVGEVVRSAQFILYKLFGSKVANQVCITSNRNNDIKLKDIYDFENRIKGSKWSFDLKWIIISYSTRLEYHNSKIKVVQLEYADIPDKIIEVVSNINLKNKFLASAANLYWMIAQELNGISYTLSEKNKWNNLNLKVVDADIYVHVFRDGVWLMDIELYIKEYGKNWIFKFFGDRKDEKIKVKDEL
ncbi:MAG: hypothetical protein REH79_02955 [Spiroplasma sp.]|nr:hypothetical protein [Spiroplasma sp.]